MKYTCIFIACINFITDLLLEPLDWHPGGVVTEDGQTGQY